MKDSAIAQFISRHSRIGIDTNILIGLIEGERDNNIFRKTFKEIQIHHQHVWASAIIIPEVMIKPVSLGNQATITAYESILFDGPILLVGISIDAANLAVKLGSSYHLKATDAIILSSLIMNGVTGFITADTHFKDVQDLDVLLLAGD